MRVQHTSARGRRARGALAAALGVLLVAAAALLPSAPASAMVQVGAVPSGVPGSSVQAIVQNQNGGSGTWTITAPPDTVITAAQSRPGTGLGQFTCAPVNGGAQANCGTSFWGAGNQVFVTLAIAPTATLGEKTGSSGIAPIEAAAPYSITVVPPAAPTAPTLTAPPSGDESIVTQPTITGTKTAGPAETTGTTLTATIDGEPLCTVPPGTDTAWSCTPAAPLAVGEHTVSATQTDRFGQTSPAATSTFSVLAPAGLAIRQAGGTPLYAGFPAVHTITVANSGEGEARGVSFTTDTAGLELPVCELDGAALDCSLLATGLDLGTIAPGAERVVRLTIAAPAGTAPGTAFTIATRASSTTASVSPVDASSTLVTSAPTAPVITAPADGSSTTARRVGVYGDGVLPGSTVSVRQGDTVLCVATGRASTLFSCTPDRTFPLGSVTLTATQTFGGVESAPGSTTFTVRQPTPVTPPGGTTPDPGTGGGSAGGGGGSAGGPGSGGTGPGTGSGGGSAAPGTGGGTGTGTGTGTGPGVGTGTSAGNGPGSGGPAGSGGTASGAGSAAGNGGSAAGSGGEPNGNGDDGNGAGAGSGNGSGSGSDGSGSGSGDGSGTNDGPLAMDLRFGTQRIVPGTAADMRGTLGPNASGATVAITFQGRMSTGMVYRDVAVFVDDQPLDCSVATTTFSCMIPLDAGQQADVAVRVYADPVNAPDTAVQQISLASNRSSQANAMTVTTAVAKAETEASQLADQITTFNVTEFPGAMVPLLAMLLFALAATVAGRRSGGGPAAVASAPTTGTGPPGASRASSPTSPTDPTSPTNPVESTNRPDQPDPTTDAPSGSNR